MTFATLTTVPNKFRSNVRTRAQNILVVQIILFTIAIAVTVNVTALPTFGKSRSQLKTGDVF